MTATSLIRFAILFGVFLISTSCRRDAKLTPEEKIVVIYNNFEIANVQQNDKLKFKSEKYFTCVNIAILEKIRNAKISTKDLISYSFLTRARKEINDEDDEKLFECIMSLSVMNSDAKKVLESVGWSYLSENLDIFSDGSEVVKLICDGKEEPFRVIHIDSEESSMVFLSPPSEFLKKFEFVTNGERLILIIGKN